MTRKHYNVLAAELSQVYELEVKTHDDVRMFWMVVNTLTDTLQRENPRFDRMRFVEAVKG